MASSRQICPAISKVSPSCRETSNSSESFSQVEISIRAGSVSVAGKSVAAAKANAVAVASDAAFPHVDLHADVRHGVPHFSVVYAGSKFALNSAGLIGSGC